MWFYVFDISPSGLPVRYNAYEMSFLKMTFLRMISSAVPLEGQIKLVQLELETMTIASLEQFLLLEC